MCYKGDPSLEKELAQSSATNASHDGYPVCNKVKFVKGLLDGDESSDGDQSDGQANEDASTTDHSENDLIEQEDQGLDQEEGDSSDEGVDDVDEELCNDDKGASLVASAPSAAKRDGDEVSAARENTIGRAGSVSGDERA